MGTLALSRDGSRLVYTSGRDGATLGSLVIKDLGDLLPHRIEGSGLRNPFLSPDGQWIGGFDFKRLIKIPAAGGSPSQIVALDGEARGASWADDGTIVFATANLETGLWRVSQAGGQPTVLTRPARDQGEADHVLPFVLPGGRGILFTVLDAATDNPRVAVLDARDQSQKLLLRGAANAFYADAGYLVYAAAGDILAVRFDLERLRVEGDPVTIASGVLMAGAAGAYYAVSLNGSVVYVPEEAAAGPARTLVWVDRRGTETALDAPPRPYTTVKLSPDGRRIALTINDARSDVWTWDLQRQTLSQITVDRREDTEPIWTADGQHLIFNSRRAGGRNLYRQRADGTGASEPLTKGQSTFVATAITSDGGVLVGHSSIPKPWTLFTLRLGQGAVPEPLLPSASSDTAAALSPDGRFLAYRSAPEGQTRDEIYVRPFPNVDDFRTQISAGGGSSPVWAPDRRQLFYLDGSDRLTAVAIDSTAPTFRAGAPVRLLPVSYWVAGAGKPGGRSYLPFDVSPLDGRFLMIKQDPSARRPETSIVMIWNAIGALTATGARP